MNKIALFLVAISTTILCVAQGESPFEMVSSHEDISLKNIRVLALPTMGAYFISGNELYALDEASELKTITFPETVPVDDVIWNDDDFIIKSGNRVYAFKDIAVPRLEFETANFKIFPCDKGKIYVVSRRGDISHLYMANLKLKKAQRMVNLHGEVLNVAKRGAITWVTTNECIYRFDGDICEIIFRFQEPVNSVVMTPAGLLFATNNAINILTGKDTFITLLEGENPGVVFDGVLLYVITEQNDLVRCHGAYINAVIMLMDALIEDEAD